MEADSSLYCSLCNKQFFRAHELKVHLKSVQHNAVLQHIQDLKEEEEQTKLSEAQEKARKADLKSKTEAIINKFHNSMLRNLDPPAAREEPKSATLTESIETHYKFSRPRKNIQLRRKILYRLVMELVAELFPDAKLEVYGSIPHKLDSESSDIDVSIISSENQIVLLNTIADGIDVCDSPYLKVSRIMSARIPLITIEDCLSKLQLDLSIWMLDKLEISSVFSAYFKMDSRVLPLLKAIRYWGKQRKINDAYTGTINSFAYTVMAVAYLMVEKVLPTTVDLKQLEDTSWWQPQSQRSVGELFIGFFKWVLDFDYKEKRISLRYGGITDKEAEKFTDDTIFVVERPRTPYQNMTRQITAGSIKLIRYEFHRALEMLTDGALLCDVASFKK